MVTKSLCQQQQNELRLRLNLIRKRAIIGEGELPIEIDCNVLSDIEDRRSEFNIEQQLINAKSSRFRCKSKPRAINSNFKHKKNWVKKNPYSKESFSDFLTFTKDCCSSSKTASTMAATEEVISSEESESNAHSNSELDDDFSPLAISSCTQEEYSKYRLHNSKYNKKWKDNRLKNHYTEDACEDF